MKTEHISMQSYRDIENLVYRVDRLFNQLMLQPENGESKIQAVVNALVTHTRTNPDAMIGIAHLRTDVKYSVIRAIQNTLFALLVSDEMEWFDEERIHSLCCAALTEHISLYPLRDTLGNQPDGLTPWQYQMIQAYPQKAVKLLLSIGVTDQRWIHTVGAHGSETLDLEEVSSEIAILSVVNRYGAMITERGPRKPMPVEQAIQMLLKDSSSEKEREIMTTLLYCVGFYPPGSAVLLENGETAIVTHRATADHPLQLASICDANGERFERPQPRDTHIEENQINHSLYLDWVQHLNCEMLWSGEDSAQEGPLFQFDPSTITA